MSAKVLIIDGHSLAFRAFYGYPVESFMTSTGQHTNAVYGFVSMFLAVVRAEKPTHIGVAFDKSRTTFRTQAYEGYKATRGATPEEFIGQVELIKDLLDALRIPHLELDDYEADDILASWVAQARTKELEVVISTGDRDAFQLIDEAVTVLYPGRNEVQRMTPEAIVEKYGVTPGRYPELAALVGETSDNLPGVPGVGPKTAAKWLCEYDGLENLIRRADQVAGKAGESLREHIPDVERNRSLNALVRDLDLPIGVGDLARAQPNLEGVNELFDALQFRALRDRVRELFQTAPLVEAPPKSVQMTELGAGHLRAWLADHGREQAGVEVVASARGDVESIAIASSDGHVAWAGVSNLTPEDDAALGAWLVDPRVTKVVHNVKEALVALWASGWDLESVSCDTQLAGYLINPDRRVFDLASLVERYLQRSLVVSQADTCEQPAFDFDEKPQSEAAGLGASAVYELAEPLGKELQAQGAQSLLRDVEIPLARVLARMEVTGIAVDTEFLRTLRSQFDARVTDAELKAFDAIGHPTNLSSPKQLQSVLFDELGMPKTRKTKSGYTTDAEALDSLYAKTAHPFLEHLLAHRDAIRLRQTVEGLIKSAQDDARIHTTYLQTVAATGRLSSQDPNLQNIPARTPAGGQIRGAFIPGNGYESLMTADYSQIEMRIMAHLCGDETLIEAFRSGQDFHTVMAAHVFGLEPDQITPAERSRVKAVNYGLAYGLSAFGLSNQLKVSVGEATRLMEGYFERFGRVRDYLNSLVVEARKTGFTETLLGRRRYLADLSSPHRTRREMAERMALNAPIQGSAADIIKLAMLKVNERLDRDFTSRMLLQVHDELVFEVAPGEREALEQMVRAEMGTAVELSVPLEVSVGVGDTWASAAH